VTTRLVRVHGLVVRTDLQLAGSVDHDGEADVEVLVAEGGPPPDGGVPPGRLVAELVDGERRFYTVVRAGDGWLLRFHGLCDFEIAADADRVRWRPTPGTDEEAVALLATGTLLALVRRLRGECVLHASAVEIGGRCWGFFGPSGSGKSTTAALLAATGARIVADDVLRVAIGARPHVVGRSEELRLRSGAGDLLELLPGAPSHRRTVDGRTAVRPEPFGGDRLPIALLAAPRPVAAGGTVEVEVMEPAEAVFRLTAVDRVARWFDHERAAEQFGFATELARHIPVVHLLVPRSHPLRPEVAQEVRDALQEVSGDLRGRRTGG
jgi:hypothetical protein